MLSTDKLNTVHQAEKAKFGTRFYKIGGYLSQASSHRRNKVQRFQRAVCSLIAALLFETTL